LILPFPQMSWKFVTPEKPGREKIVMG